MLQKIKIFYASPVKYRNLNLKSVIQWALDGKNHGNGYGFPFDRTHFEFYQRLCKVYDTLESWNLNQIEIMPNALKYIQKLKCDIKPLRYDTNGKKSAEIIQEKSIVFDELRKAMCITLESSKKGLNDNGEDVDIKTIEHRIKDFKSNLCKKKIYSENQNYQKMTSQIEKYWEKLFADPITIETPDGDVIIQPQRTNNIMEQFFRGFRRTERRRSGNNSICKRLRTMISETLLVKNLDNKEYMEILLQGKSELHQCFADIEHEIFQKEFEKSKQYEEKIPPAIKKAIRLENIPDLMNNLFEKHKIS